jgi:hypothetical protein
MPAGRPCLDCSAEGVHQRTLLAAVAPGGILPPRRTAYAAPGAKTHAWPSSGLLAGTLCGARGLAPTGDENGAFTDHSDPLDRPGAQLQRHCSRSAVAPEGRVLLLAWPGAQVIGTGWAPAGQSREDGAGRGRSGGGVGSQVELHRGWGHFKICRGE